MKKMKSKLSLSFLTGLTGLLLGGAVDSQAQPGAIIPGFPQEVSEMILNFAITDTGSTAIPSKILPKFAQVNRAWKQAVQNQIRLNPQTIDFTNVVFNQDKFKRLFGSEGFFHEATDLLFSWKSFQGDWIQYLDTRHLQLRPDGSARLKAKTNTGALYEYVGTHPNLGPGWRDQSNLIWWDVLKNDGEPHLGIPQAFAKGVCEQLGARLPRFNELVRLATSLGATFDDFGHLTEDSHTEDSHTEDSHTEDSHTEDSHTEDSHTEDSHYRPQILPSLKVRFWSNDEVSPSRYFIFLPSEGSVVSEHSFHYNVGVRCVQDSPRS